MPSTSVTITVPEADVPAVVKALCNHAGLPVLNANAKPALIQIVRELVEREKRQEATITAPTIE